jgi:tetratricopeptide (TPR) repeat protein
LVVVPLLLVLCVGGWLVAEPLREDRAAAFDREVSVALDQGKYSIAASRAHYASTLRATPDRRQTEAATAFLNGDFRAATDRFSDIPGTPGVIGRSAAQTRLGKKVAAATDVLLSAEERAVMAALALDRGDQVQLRALLTGTAIENDTIALLAAAAAIVDDPARAAAVISASPGGTMGVETASPAYGAMLQSILRQSDQSMQAFFTATQEALRSNSEPSRLVFLATALYQSEKYHAAAAIAEQAITAAPNYRDAYVTKALSMLAQGKPKDAKRSIDTALKLDPAYGYAWFVKSRILDALGDKKAATDARASASRFLYASEPSPSASK